MLNSIKALYWIFPTVYLRPIRDFPLPLSVGMMTLMMVCEMLSFETRKGLIRALAPASIKSRLTSKGWISCERKNCVNEMPFNWISRLLSLINFGFARISPSPNWITIESADNSFTPFNERIFLVEREFIKWKTWSFLSSKWPELFETVFHHFARFPARDGNIQTKGEKKKSW